MTDKEITAALQVVDKVYGLAFTKRIEQLFRNETAHFKSENFLITLSPGMEAISDKIPYGWGLLSKFWSANPKYAPTGLHLQKDNNSALSKSTGFQKFIIFPSIEASMMSVAYQIHLKGDNAGTWFNNNPDDQKRYNTILDTIVPRFSLTLK